MRRSLARVSCFGRLLANRGRRSALLILAAISMAGSASCTSRSALPPAVVQEQPPASAPRILSHPLARQSPSARARELLEAGAFEEAKAQYARILQVPENHRERAEALWSLALIHLLPMSPFHDPLQARAYLHILADRFPDTLHGMQAVWVNGILGDLDDSRARMADQERVLQEVRDTMERLREIDLDRRPTGRPPPPTPGGAERMEGPGPVGPS